MQLHARFRSVTPICLFALAATSPVLAATAFPTGTYMMGDVSATFDDKGHVHLSQKDKTMVDGDYTATGEEIRLTDKSGPMACLDAGTETGVYRWKLDNDALTFTKITDSCDGRSGDLTAQAWKRKR